GQAVAKIQGGPLQKRGALLINQKLHAVALYDRVSGAFLVQSHFVVQPGTTALCDLDTQTFFRPVRLRFKQGPQLPDSVVRDVDHWFFKVRRRPIKSTARGG